MATGEKLGLSVLPGCVQAPDLVSLLFPGSAPHNTQAFMQSLSWHLQLTPPAQPTSLSGKS